MDCRGAWRRLAMTMYLLSSFNFETRYKLNLPLTPGEGRGEGMIFMNVPNRTAY